MQDEVLKTGDNVTIRKGAPLTPDGKRRLAHDCRGRVIAVSGRKVTVETDQSSIMDDEGSQLRAPFALVDVSYVYRREEF